MEFVNTTPHDITYYHGDGTTTVIPSSGWQVRADMWYQNTEIVNNKTIPLLIHDYQGIAYNCIGNAQYHIEEDDFKALYRETGKYIICSKIIADCVRERAEKHMSIRAVGDFNLLVPDTGPESVVRDDNGRILGVKRFIKI